MSTERGYIVLIPLEKTSIINRLSIERRTTIDTNDQNILHIGGGNNTDLIIYKNAQPAEPLDQPVQCSSQFQVQINDLKHKKRMNENRTLKFWFSIHDKNRYTIEMEKFMHHLIKTEPFPRDYFSFIKRLMELLREFATIKRIHLDIQVTTDNQEIENEHPMYKKNAQRQSDIIKEKLLDLLERAFPNAMMIDDLAKYVESDDSTVSTCLAELEDKNLVKHLDNEQQQWIRVIVSIEEEQTHRVIVYKSISEFSNRFHPTIAIITVNYFEKLAVDSMIENKITFVRHRTGESNVYTIGVIGNHHVVSTKLPLIGRSRTAQISIGSTTTRLFGIFQHIEHVFIVGCAGGVAHYHDANKHIRRGDVVVAYPNEEDYVYGIYEAEQSPEGYEFVSTCYKPKNFELYYYLQSIRETITEREVNVKFPWEEYLEQGIQHLLSHNVDCLPPMTDRLLMKTDDGETIEVEHPKNSKRDHFKPKIHFGMIAGGKNIVNNEYFKETLNEKCDVLCFDSEIDQVLAAIQGNRIESFLIIRGISDYYDGTSNKDWQPFSSLCAAALMKTIVLQILATSHSNTEQQEIL